MGAQYFIGANFKSEILCGVNPYATNKFDK